MCPNWICTVVSPYRGKKKRKKEKTETCQQNLTHGKHGQGLRGIRRRRRRRGGSSPAAWARSLGDKQGWVKIALKVPANRQGGMQAGSSPRSPFGDPLPHAQGNPLKA